MASLACPDLGMGSPRNQPRGRQAVPASCHQGPEPSRDAARPLESGHGFLSSEILDRDHPDPTDLTQVSRNDLVMAYKAASALDLAVKGVQAQPGC